MRIRFALFLMFLIDQSYNVVSISLCVCLLCNLGWTLGAVLYENSLIEYDCEHAAAAAVADDDDDDDVDIRVMLSRLLIVGDDKNIS